MLAMAQWALAFSLEITSSALATKLIWAKFQYLGIVILPVAWLVFVLEFTGNESWITRRNVFSLSLIPTATFLLALTNEMHELVWQTVEYGLWFWVHTLFSYSCLLLATVILIKSWRREVAGLYRWQYVALLFGLLLPWTASILYVTGLTPQELTTFSFLISGGALVHYTLRFRLFDVTPVAHRAVVSSLSDAIMVLDSQARIADVNPAAEKIVGMPATDLVGKAFNELWPNLYETVPEAQQKPVEIKLGPESNPSYYEVTSSPLQDWRNSPRGHLLVFHDISRQKELEHRRENMTHNMVHDLRDPLTNSIFALELLKGDMSSFDSPESYQLLDMTYAQTMKTLGLVDEILDINRLKNGIEIAVIRTTIALPELIAKVIRAQSSRAVSKQVEISSDLPEMLPSVWADASLIERVLQNLIDNSIKFSPPGGTIRITAAAADNNGNGPGRATRLLISVSDEGPGIPGDLQEKVFDTFVAGPNKASGSGLGLAFCRMAVLAHGEQIWIESEPRRGCTLTFSLPISSEPIEVAQLA
jgi:PAS domain S-box-containing protein